MSIISSDPNILGGEPVFRGTRVPFKSLTDYLEHGKTLSEFLEDFPSVSRWRLPTRLARLSCAVAEIFMRKSATSTAAAAARRTPLLRARFAHFEIPPADIFSVQACDCLRCLSVIGHFHESEASRAAGLSIHCDVNARDLPERLEQLTQIVFGRLETHIADK
jgi:uncharacterized protein (DUF433 family)